MLAQHLLLNDSISEMHTYNYLKYKLGEIKTSCSTLGILVSAGCIFIMTSVSLNVSPGHWTEALIQTGKHLPEIVIISVILGICIIIIYKPAPTAWSVCSTEGEREGGLRRGDKGQGSTVGSALETRL